MAATNKCLARINKSRTRAKRLRSGEALLAFDERPAALRNVGPGTMAAMNKSLAQRNKSRTWAETTNKREISQSSLVGNGVCGVARFRNAKVPESDALPTHF
jgi:hypothetical protein